MFYDNRHQHQDLLESTKQLGIIYRSTRLMSLNNKKVKQNNKKVLQNNAATTDSFQSSDKQSPHTNHSSDSDDSISELHRERATRAVDEDLRFLAQELVDRLLG